MVEIKSILPLKRGTRWVISINYVTQWMDEFSSHNTDDITDALNIPRNIYIQTLLKEFDGSLSTIFNVYFDNKENCQRAVDWVNSQAVMNKITNKCL